MDDFNRPPFSMLPLEAFTFQSVTLNAAGEEIEHREESAFRFREAFDAGVMMELVAVPGGTFQMGSPHGQGYEDEIPRHLVSLRPFLMSQFLITQQQWQAVTGKQPRCRFTGPLLPVERVSWKDAQDFCKRLSKKTGHSYHLPSEAQWEYACRAGTSTAFCTGDTITTDFANYCGDHTYRNEPRGLYRHISTPAGTFLPNHFGLQDLHGNLWEWCADRWHPDYSGAPFDGTPWEQGGERGCRAARGGSWHEPPANCRSATRLRAVEDTGDDMIGFRVVME